LQGAEVIRLHRLMKNSVTAETGIKAYALVTEQAAAAIGLPDFFAATSRHVEKSGDFGDTVCYVYDLAPIYARWRASRRIMVLSDEPLAFESMECDLPVPPAVCLGLCHRLSRKRSAGSRQLTECHDRTFRTGGRGGRDRSTAPMARIRRSRHRRLAAVRVLHLVTSACRWAHRAADRGIHPARQRRHASVAALRPAAERQPPGADLARIMIAADPPASSKAPAGPKAALERVVAGIWRASRVDADHPPGCHRPLAR
jgi:hypothetical protein